MRCDPNTHSNSYTDANAKFDSNRNSYGNAIIYSCSHSYSYSNTDAYSKTYSNSKTQPGTKISSHPRPAAVGCCAMSKTTLTGFILVLLLLFTSFEARSGNPATKDSQRAGDLADAKSLADSGYRVPVANGVPRPDHVVIVIEENHSYSEIIGSPAAPYINSLAAIAKQPRS